MWPTKRRRWKVSVASAGSPILRATGSSCGSPRPMPRSATICHGPCTLAEAGVLAGRQITSFPSVRTDLRNAGSTVLDEEVVVDEGLVSSRSPDDLPAFCAKIVEEFAEGRHADRAVGATAS